MDWILGWGFSSRVMVKHCAQQLFHLIKSWSPDEEAGVPAKTRHEYWHFCLPADITPPRMKGLHPGQPMKPAPPLNVLPLSRLNEWPVCIRAPASVLHKAERFKSPRWGGDLLILHSAAITQRAAWDGESNQISCMPIPHCGDNV